MCNQALFGLLQSQKALTLKLSVLFLIEQSRTIKNDACAWLVCFQHAMVYNCLLNLFLQGLNAACFSEGSDFKQYFYNSIYYIHTILNQLELPFETCAQYTSSILKVYIFLCCIMYHLAVFFNAKIHLMYWKINFLSIQTLKKDTQTLR